MFKHSNVPQKWLNLSLIFGIGLILPIYYHMFQTYQLTQTAKKTGVWNHIPTNRPNTRECIDAIQKKAKTLSLKMNIQQNIITVESLDSLPIYNLLNYISQLPISSVESFSLQDQKGKRIGTIKISIPTSNREKCRKEQLWDMDLNDNGIDFYSPRFFYVNASTEVDGHKQIWVNGKNFGESYPWPLYHTFDKQPGSVKKGDLRPRLALTSKV